jgi:hypothetical protein
MPSGEFVPVTIPLYYEGHAYRTGSRIRVTIAAPNGTQPIWAFDETEPEGSAQVAIAYGGGTPSSLLLPVVPGVSVPTGLPPCPGLRGEPCRAYQELANVPAAPAAGEPPKGTLGSGGGGSTTTPAAPATKRLKCRKGFRKKRVKHRVVCRKAKKHHHNRRHHRRHHHRS